MLLSPFKYTSPFAAGRGGVFSIAKSFYFDGVNQYFRTPKGSLSAYLNGATTEWTYIAFVKRVGISTIQQIFGDTESKLFISFQANNKIQVRVRNSVDGDTFCNTVSTYANATNYYHIAVRFKYSESLGSRTQIFVNGVSVSVVDDTASYHDNPTNYYTVGSRGQVTDWGNYYQSQFSLNDYLSDAEILAHYNSGKPLNANTLFGVRNYMFMNPDDSDDTAQFTITDSINSISWESLNMTNANKTPITPYEDKLANLVTKYGFLNAWSGEKTRVNGTTTTAFDYLGEHNLSNPAVANQPTFNGGSADFNNRPIIDFDGIDDYLEKAVANWRSADSSGVFIAVVNTTGNYYFSTADIVSNSNWFSMYKSGANIHGFIKDGAVVVQSDNSYTGANVYASVGTGTEFKEIINGLDETNSPASYSWLDSLPTQRDNIVIGGVQRLTPLYANVDLAFCGYLPYSDDATIIALQNELKTIFGI